MTREQHDAAPNGDRCGCRTPPSSLLPSGADMRQPHPEQAALLLAAGMLVPSLAHELSNPLCGVRSMLERMARKPAQDDAERHLLRLALHQCDQMRLLLRELQEFVAPSSAEGATFALDETLESVLLLVRKQLRICGYSVEFTRPAQPLFFQGAERRIRLLLVHLLLRCCHAPLSEGGRLHIQAGVEGGKTQLILRWQMAPEQSEDLHLALSNDEGAPWFDAILRQHGGKLQLQQRADGLIMQMLSFPLPQEEIR